jgi:hypothetical protein
VIGTGIGVAASLGCNAALTSSTSASQGMGSVSSVSEGLADSGSSLASASSGGEESAALERDVTTYTALFAESGANVEAYRRGVGALCETYAVVDWERDPVVQRGIALGLARSRLSPDEIARFVERVSGDDAQMREVLHSAAFALR